MGSTYSFQPHVISQTCPGEQSVLSNVIEGITAEGLLEGMERYVREGKTSTGVEKSFEVLDGGDHLVVVVECELHPLLGGGSEATHTSHFFFKDKLEMRSRFYQTRAHFESGEVLCSNVALIHREPVRIEFWAEFRGLRSAGRAMERMLARTLEEMGTKARALPESRSPSDPSKLSVVSEPIEDVEVTPATFLAFFKKFILETMQGTELPDGSVVEERGSVVLDTLGLMAKSFVKHEFVESERRLCCHEYGEDEAMQEEIGITHLRVHEAPFRLEQYHCVRPGRRAGEAEAKLIESFATGVLKFMS